MYPFSVGEAVEVRSTAYADDGANWHPGVVTHVDDYESSAPYKVASPANTDGDGWDWILVENIRKLPGVVWQFKSLTGEWHDLDDSWDNKTLNVYTSTSTASVTFRRKPIRERTPDEVLAKAREVVSEIYAYDSTIARTLRGDF